MSNIVVKLTGQHSRSIVTSSLAQANNKNYLPGFLRSLGEALGPFRALASIQILNDDAAAATGTITIADNTKVTANDVYKIGTFSFTAKASGASGAQFNIGASATLTAQNLARAIGVNTSGLFSASSAAGVVTITCLVSGPLGNAIPIVLTQTDSGGATTSASLSGGSSDTATAKDYRQF